MAFFPLTFLAAVPGGPALGVLAVVFLTAFVAFFAVAFVAALVVFFAPAFVVVLFVADLWAVSPALACIWSAVEAGVASASPGGTGAPTVSVSSVPDWATCGSSPGRGRGGGEGGVLSSLGGGVGGIGALRGAGRVGALDAPGSRASRMRWTVSKILLTPSGLRLFAIARSVSTRLRAPAEPANPGHMVGAGEHSLDLGPDLWETLTQLHGRRKEVSQLVGSA